MMQTSLNNSSVNFSAVQLKAYELWLSGGCLEGVAEQNWAEAERMVHAESTEKQHDVRTTAASEPPPSAPKSSPLAQAIGKQSIKKTKRH